ncbi:hypothetical protein O7635_09115 [Asanoa sp. WMMD1127]|uniref:hypothetical protein n=1 Tax=Asanoa sp. WMMD1127 TaxID=3016107 RepID=UPI002416A6AC|nr:hypothetical protein [Asanoa sp. WMMD1127]MDG4822013.1 hypothetical protein [Asanoa sp. WMMD1127]
MDARIEHFAQDVIERFGYLVAEFGFTGPDVDHDELVGYTRGPWQVWLGLDVRNKTVDANIRFCEGDVDVHAPLGEVVKAAGLGGAQRAPTSAQTRAGMAASLTKQATALRDVAPLLGGRSGYELLTKAIGGEAQR